MKKLKLFLAILLLPFSSFALLCLSNCGNSEPSEVSSAPNGLYVKCLQNAMKPLVEVEEAGIEVFAVLTNSNEKTHIHLNEIGLNCAATDPKLFKINYAVDVDTLKLNGVFDEAYAKCNCTSSLDLTIESIGDNIKYLVYIDDYGGVSEIFPVKYE